jgi:hypothetical protein
MVWPSLRRFAVAIGFAMACAAVSAQTLSSEPRPFLSQIAVKLVLVQKSEICKGPYIPGNPDCRVTVDDAEFLEKKYGASAISGPYSLPVGKRMPLKLNPEFQQALIADIDAGTWAVLLEFEWKSSLLFEVDLARDLCGHPSSNLRSDRGKHWYTHQNAADFDPDKNVKWQMMLAGPAASYFCFFVVPAR